MSEESEMEKRFEEGVLGTITSSSPPPSGNNSVSNVSNRQHPGAALLSPQVQASNTPSILMSPQPFAQSGGQISGLLSPSGSRYKFESEEPEILAPRPMSPIIDTSMSGFNNRPLIIDNLLSNLPEDILAYARTKVEDLTYQKQSEQSHIVAPQPLYQSSSMHEPATLDSILNGSQQPWSPPTAASNLQRALSPNFVSPMDRGSVLVHEAAMLNRPRSADPYSKTPSKNRGYQYGHNNENHTDDRGRHLTNDDYNRTSSVPPPQRVNYYESLHNQGKDLSKMASLNSATKGLTLDDSNSLTPLKSPQSPTSGQPKSPAINPKQITNPKLLADIPSWLKTLRLHKYTPCLQDTPWKELIYFDDEKLTQKGVTAMGARGKLLKAFEVVRQYYEDGLIPSASA
ncbi:Protein VTS1 [Cyberlindnera fabianii]|uniref:RNA-binding protein VTS1 n=1 Tax=Cyberlindnera fabianii TaxID=36022 RepID=A0A1V2L4D1_CYBFA|nr:Protein VTS1 [Cyberlindnera fabianii]